MVSKTLKMHDASCLNIEIQRGAVKTVMLLVLFKKFSIILQTFTTIKKIQPCTYSNLLGFSHKRKWERHSTTVVEISLSLSLTHTHTQSYVFNEQTLHTIQTQILFYSVP
jgi:hypothetical protein